MSEIAVRSPVQELVAQIRAPQFLEQLKLALPPEITPERFGRVTVTALLQNADLALADRNSFYQSVIKAATDGLLPDGREAALLVYQVKGVPTVQYLPMIGGYRKIAAEHGWAIRSAVVYENDTFEYDLGLDHSLVHKPPRPGIDRGEPIGAYAVGVHGDGRKEFEVMNIGDIEKVRQVSRAKDRGPWVDWWERMAEKTAARRLFTKLPRAGRDERVERVLAVDHAPAEATAMLYGPKAGQVFQASLAAGTAGDDGATTGLPQGADRSEDAVGTPSPPAASSADNDAAALADSAGKQKFPVTGDSHPWPGKKIVDLHFGGEVDGLAWALEPARSWNNPADANALFGEALEVYCSHYLPDIVTKGDTP